MTNQEIFDKVSKHLLNQMEKSSGRGVCKYRKEQGSTDKIRCSIGCLIPDKMYRSQMENHTVDLLLRDFIELRILLIGKNLNNQETQRKTALLRELQLIHDCDKITKWESQLKRTCKTFNLEWNN